MPFSIPGPTETAPRILLLVAVFLSSLSLPDESRANPYFRIHAIVMETKRGIPLVRFTVPNAKIDSFTDSAGMIAFLEPGLMGEEVYFVVSGNGYEIPKNELGERGIKIRVEAGETAIVELQRTVPGQRLYRLTGLAPYRDSRLLGDPIPSPNPPLNAKIVGQDSVFVEKYKNSLFWLWGDTSTPGHLRDWNVEVTAASSELPGPGGFDPEVGPKLNYFKANDGASKKMIAPEFGGALTWLDGLVNLRDGEGLEHLFAHYVQMRRVPLAVGNLKKDPALEMIGAFWADDAWADAVALERRAELGEEAVQEYREWMKSGEERTTKVTRGLVRYNDERKFFEHVAEFPDREVLDLHIGAHTFRAADGTVEHLYFPGLYPNRRVIATIDALQDIERYESFSCLKAGERFANDATQLDRNEEGILRYSWKRNTTPIGPEQQKQLLEAGHIRPEERWIVFRDVETGLEIDTQHNSIAWNDYRGRYIGLFTQSTLEEGEGTLGETWFAEADTPMGPWAYMEKVATFDNYSFYNPSHSPLMNKEGGRVIFFEGTYTRFMGKEISRTPHYDYNQLMYKLELDDPRLFLPVPVYEVDNETMRYVTKKDLPTPSPKTPEPLFLAPDRPRQGTIPVYEFNDENGFGLSTKPGSDSDRSRIAFYAHPDAGDRSGDHLKPLFESHDPATGERNYFIPDESSDRNPDASDEPLCYVWENPSRINPFTLGDWER